MNEMISLWTVGVGLGAALLCATVATADGQTGGVTGVAATPPSLVDLSAEGSVDWVHWGLIRADRILHRKKGVPARIGELVRRGEREVHTYENNPTAYTWSDGAPTEKITRTRSGIFSYGADGQFEFTVPADSETPRILKVYVGVWRANGRLEAFLGDAQTPVYSYLVEPKPDVEMTNVVCALTFGASSGDRGKMLRIRWSHAGAGGGNIELQAATLGNAAAK
jgi:hypothetical protein